MYYPPALGCTMGSIGLKKNTINNTANAIAARLERDISMGKKLGSVAAAPAAVNARKARKNAI